jgi:hypothetical protein
MIIGGIACGTAFLPELFSILTAIQDRMPFRDRLEWKAITKRNHHIFVEVIDKFFELNSEHLVDFHALVVDMHKFDHMTLNKGDKEVSFDKLLFQSLYGLNRRYPNCSKLRCFHGNRDSPYRIGDLREMLNNKAFKQSRVGRIHIPYAIVKNLEVKRSLPLQLGDLLIGCLGAHWNRRKGAVVGSPKDIVAQHFKRESPVLNLTAATAKSDKHFVIWPLKSGLRA